MLVTRWREALQHPSTLPLASFAKATMWLLVVILAWVLGKLLWQVMAPSIEEVRWRPNTVAVNVDGQSEQIDLRELQQMSLFGKYEPNKAPPVKQEVVQEAPETKLNLNLVGVVASKNPATALAVIANRNQQATYGIDETIEGTRASLVAVYVDRVIIRNSGRDETLMLDGNAFEANAPAQRRPASRPAPSAPATSEDVVSEKLTQIKQELTESPQNMFNYIRLSKVQRDGELQGYRVNPGKDRALFDAVGLKPNDLAVSLNGNDLKDPAAMASLFEEIQQATSLSLSVEREGQLHDIYIDLQ